MQQKICWLCDNEMTKTDEHIIPESMGGKKTVRYFICRDCNSRTGHDWDAAVTSFESWKFIADKNLRINPRQGRPIRARMADTGLNVFVGPGIEVKLGFNPPTKTESESGEVEYELTYDPSRVDALFNSVNTIRHRNGMSPLRRTEFDACINRSEMPGPVVHFKLQLKIPKYYRSLVKTAMAMAFSLGVNPMDCENSVRYLRDEELGEEGVVSLPGTSLQGIIDDWLNYHAVTIFSIPKERMLLGEVVYFGNAAGLVVLSNEYDGPSIIAGHSINLKTGVIEDADLDVLRNLQDLYLPPHSAMELARTRIGRFKSPMVLQILNDLDRMALKAG